MSSNAVDIHDLQKVLSRMANQGGQKRELILPEIEKQPTRLDRMKEYTNALSARGFQASAPPKTARTSKTESSTLSTSKKAKSESVELNCGPCMRDGMQHEVAGYCIDCSEYFCENCIKHHQNLKITKNHVVRDRKKMPKLGKTSSDDELIEVCPLHSGETFRYYCKDHEEACCGVCATLKHRGCQELVYIPDLSIKKTKKTCNALMKQIKRLIGQYHHVKEDTNKNAHLLHIEKSDFQQAILKIHQDVLDLLHLIEKEIVADLSHVYDSEMGYLCARMDMTDDAVSVLKQASIQLEMAKQNGLEKRLFLQTKKVTKQVEHYESLLSEIRSKNSQPLKIAFRSNKQVKNFLKEVKTLGDLEIVEKPDRNAIPYTQFKASSRSENSQVSDITGSTVMTDGRVVLADRYNESLKLVNSAYKMITQSKLSSEPWDICSVSSDQVVVSLPKERKLQFYAIDITMRPLKRIGQNDSVKGSQYYGLAYNQEKIFVTCPTDEVPNVKILDLQGRLLHQINANQQEQALFANPLHIAVKYDGKTAYISDSGNYSIIAIDIAGNSEPKIFQIPDGNPPRGIVAVPDGNVYYCGCKTNMLESLSLSMESFEEVRGSERLLVAPQSLSYCEKQRRLIVTMQKQDTVQVLQLF